MVLILIDLRHVDPVGWMDGNITSQERSHEAEESKVTLARNRETS